MALEFVRLQFLDKGVLEKLCSTDWLEHLEWLLGEDVHGVTVRSSYGGSLHSPPWASILEIDFQVRKRAAWLSNNTGRSLALTLVEAREDEKLCVVVTVGGHTVLSVHTFPPSPFGCKPPFVFLPNPGRHPWLMIVEVGIGKCMFAEAGEVIDFHAFGS